MFKAYIQALCKGPLLASTKHNMVLTGTVLPDSLEQRCWTALCDAVGREAADRQVRAWIKRPRKL